jgi:hypothetical protein
MKLQQYILSATRASLAYKSEEELNDIWEHSCPEIFKNVQSPPKFYSAQGSQAYSWIQDEVFYLSFRGTDELTDILTDIDLQRSKLFDDDSNILVHNGFLNYFNTIKQDIQTEITISASSFHTIHVTGHSLGGALATIGAAYLGKFINMPDSGDAQEGEVTFKPKDKSKKRIVCHTFGSPRVGNLKFVDWFHTQVDESMRIANDDDPVTLFPISCLYSHISEALCIGDKCIKEVHSDIKWYWRLFSFPFYKSSIQDHSCNMYIRRLIKSDKLQKLK